MSKNPFYAARSLALGTQKLLYQIKGVVHIVKGGAGERKNWPPKNIRSVLVRGVEEDGDK